jgi:hypothetical protein
VLDFLAYLNTTFFFIIPRACEETGHRAVATATTTAQQGSSGKPVSSQGQSSS